MSTKKEDEKNVEIQLLMLLLRNYTYNHVGQTEKGGENM